MEATDATNALRTALENYFKTQTASKFDDGCIVIEKEDVENYVEEAMDKLSDHLETFLNWGLGCY